jgi:prolyl-tRNA synthetase
LGTRYTEALGAEFLDRDGQSRPVIMGSYGIGTGRLLACIAEQYHDEAGLAWPVSVAPFAVYLVVLLGKKSSGEPGSAGSEDTNLSIANSIYESMWQAGVEVLMDDRQETPGVKFKDADLIGLPLRITVSERALAAGGIEFKRRDRQEREVIPISEVVSRTLNEIAVLQAEINQRVVEVSYTV